MRAALLLASIVACVAACRSESDPAPQPPPAPVHTGGAQPAAASTANVSKGGLVEGSNLRPHKEEPVVECPAKIGDGVDDDARLTALLDEANKQIEKAQYGA